jgi:F-type H+-transporting ATPase subunit alpha
MHSQQKSLMDKMASELALTDEIESGLHEALKDFKEKHAY